jgi:mRNA interferase MazF
MATYDRYKPFDVIVVPFPYSDQAAEKRRPALVVSDDSLIAFGVLWLAMITSADNPPWACDVPIADLKRAGLPGPSVVRTAKIACIEPSRIIRRAGTLESLSARRVARRLREFLASAG